MFYKLHSSYFVSPSSMTWGIMYSMYTFWVHGRTRHTVQTISWLSFGFLCVPEEKQDLPGRSKTYLAEARLTWHKARLKLFLHILCSISTLLMWQTLWNFSPTKENRQVEWFNFSLTISFAELHVSNNLSQAHLHSVIPAGL